MAPTKWTKAPLTGDDGPKTRWFTQPSPKGWVEPVIMEWELAGEARRDAHEHNEYADGLDGRLFVSCDGVIVEAAVGDLVQVRARTIGRYWAPRYTRMLGIYAPTPDDHPLTHAKFEKLDPSSGSPARLG